MSLTIDPIVQIPFLMGILDVGVDSTVSVYLLPIPQTDRANSRWVRYVVSRSLAERADPKIDPSK